MSRWTRSILAAGLMLALTAAQATEPHRHAGAGDIRIHQAWAPATPPGASVAAGYLVIENGGDADRLVTASSLVAEAVTLHETSEEGGVARMRPLPDGLPVPAGGRVELSPGGAHLMLGGLKEPLREGESLPVTLVFEKAGEMDIELAVMPIGARAMSSGHAGHADPAGGSAPR